MSWVCSGLVSTCYPTRLCQVGKLTTSAYWNNWITNWTLFSGWLLHLISFVSLVSQQWSQRRLLRGPGERIGIKRGREGGWWKKQQWGCWSFHCNRQPMDMAPCTNSSKIQLHACLWCVSWLLLLLFFSKFWPQLGHDRDMIVTQWPENWVKKEEDGFENLAHVRTVDQLYLVLEGWGEIFSFKDLTYWRWLNALKGWWDGRNKLAKRDRDNTYEL